MLNTPALPRTAPVFKVGDIVQIGSKPIPDMTDNDFGAVEAQQWDADTEIWVYYIVGLDNHFQRFVNETELQTAFSEE